MEKTILVPIDHSDVSEEVIIIANDWASRTGAKLHFINATANSFFVGSHHNPEHRLNEIRKILGNHNISVEYELLTPVGKPYACVIEEEKRLNADLIIMAAHDHTEIGRLLLGSNTDYIVHHSKSSVYVYKQSKNSHNNIIMLPVDLTEINRPVVALADEWAQVIKAELCFVYVGTPPEFVHLNAEFTFEWNEIDKESVNKIQEEKFNNFVISLNVKSKYSKYLKFGTPFKKILEIQREVKANLIMMASHSHTALDRITAGSNTNSIMHSIDCPVYVYKR